MWKDDDTRSGKVNESNTGAGDSFASAGRCSTRKIVTSNCKTEEVEPGKFVRKCEKTEQLLKDCAGRPSEVVECNKEYTEEDVTGQVVKGSFPMGSSEHEHFKFPGLRSGLHSDIEAIERSMFGSMTRFFDAAEEMKNGFFNAFGTPHLYDTDSPSSSSTRRGVPIEGHPPKEASTKPSNPDGNVDLSGLARDV